MTLLFLFEQVVWASDNVTALPSSANNFHGPWKAVDLGYTRLFPYNPAKQPHPPAGCVVLHVGSHRNNMHNIDTKVLMTPAVLMLRCQERIKLLRSSRWVSNREQQQHLHGYLLLNLPEMGIHDVHTHIVAVTSSLFNPAVLAMKHTLTRPVMGVFVRHTMNVRQYTFKDTLTGKLEKIKATPNHPFYVLNQQRYIPVSRLSSHDQLVNVLGHSVTLVCPTGKSSHCGQPYRPGQVIRVYNLEIYGQHRYFVGKLGIMVHNSYECAECKKKFTIKLDFYKHIIIHTDQKPFGCKTCSKRFNRESSLIDHLKVHSGERPYECKCCNKKFAKKWNLTNHFKSNTHKRNAAHWVPDLPDTSADAQPEASTSSTGSEPVMEASNSPLGINIPSEDFIPPIVVPSLPPVEPQPVPPIPSINLRSISRSESSYLDWLSSELGN